MIILIMMSAPLPDEIMGHVLDLVGDASTSMLDRLVLDSYSDSMFPNLVLRLEFESTNTSFSCEVDKSLICFGYHLRYQSRISNNNPSRMRLEPSLFHP
jgi:hypothetical protein